MSKFKATLSSVQLHKLLVGQTITIRLPNKDEIALNLVTVAQDEPYTEEADSFFDRIFKNFDRFFGK